MALTMNSAFDALNRKLKDEGVSPRNKRSKSFCFNISITGLSFQTLSFTFISLLRLGKDQKGSKVSSVEKQVTLEEQMICGALQTLNKEMCEDVLEESEEQGTIAAASYLQVPQQPIDIITGEQMQQQSQNELINSNYSTGECDQYVVVYMTIEPKS